MFHYFDKFIYYYTFIWYDFFLIFLLLFAKKKKKRKKKNCILDKGHAHMRLCVIIAAADIYVKDCSWQDPSNYKHNGHCKEPTTTADAEIKSIQSHLKYYLANSSPKVATIPPRWFQKPRSIDRKYLTGLRKFRLYH